MTGLTGPCGIVAREGVSKKVEAAGVRRIRLHDGRHTACTLMHLAGVPAAIISQWAGHHSVAFTMATYVHGQDDALSLGAATLGALYSARDSA
jgi:integrase